MMNQESVISLLRKECDSIGGAQAWADKFDMSVTYVRDVLARRRDPAGKILDALQVERITMYSRKTI